MKPVQFKMKWAGTLSAIAVAALLATPAQASKTLDLQQLCEDAVEAQLDDGRSRFNRVALTRDDGETSFWLTLRHKTPVQAKSTRYRAHCVINAAGQAANVELEEGWWKKGRRGESPLAID